MPIIDLKTPSELGSIPSSMPFFSKEALSQEKILRDVVALVLKNLQKIYPSLTFVFKPRIFLTEIADIVNQVEASSLFNPNFDSTFISPDGGIIYVIDPNDVTKKYPILISEMKTQGTNPRGNGNAIERLGKNVIALRILLLNEQIMPFIAFCSGKAFTPSSKIIDRIATIAQFAPLNQINLFNGKMVASGSYFYQEEEWSLEEMYSVCYKIAKRALLFFASKYDIEI